jgi:hypothetical protein
MEGDVSGAVEIIAASAKRAPWGWGVLAGIIIALIKVWPVLNDQVAKVKEKRRTDKRDDMAEWREQMRAEINSLKEDVRRGREAMTAADERSHRVELKLMTVTSAFQMVAGELRKLDPENLTLIQAVEMVGTAVTEDMGMNLALTKLARVPGVGE